MKKTLAVFCTVCIFTIFIFIGCTVKDEPIYSNPELHNNALQIYTFDNQLIGEIENYGSINFATDSIIYTRLPDGKTQTSYYPTLDYYRYDLNTGNNIKLGTIDECVYQAPYRALLDNHLYISVTTGDMAETENRYVKILDIDLNNNSMSEIASYRGGNPYSFVTEVFGKIWFIQMETGEKLNKDFIGEYNPQTKELSKVKSFQFDNDSLTGETPRGIYTDDNFIYIMTLKMETEANVELRMDVYDKQMNFVRTVDLSSLDSDKNELRHIVGGFKVLDDYIYYGNFSSTIFFGKTGENGLTPVMSEDKLRDSGVASESVIDRDKLMIFNEFEGNNIYLFDKNSGSFKSSEFYSDKDKRCQIKNIFMNGDDMLIYMGGRDLQTGEYLPEMLYYINVNDLDFQDYVPEN